MKLRELELNQTYAFLIIMGLGAITYQFIPGFGIAIMLIGVITGIDFIYVKPLAGSGEYNRGIRWSERRK